MLAEHDDDNMGGVGCKKKETTGSFGKGFSFVDYTSSRATAGVMGYVQDTHPMRGLVFSGRSFAS